MADPVGTVRFTAPLATDEVDQTTENTESIEAPKGESDKSSYTLSTTEKVAIGLLAAAFVGLSAYAIFGDSSQAGPAHTPPH